MKEIKELAQATVTLVGYLIGMMFWVAAILALVAVVLSLPIFIVAGIYKVICLIGHVTFSWDIPIIIGIGFVAIFGLTGLDQMWE